jgi:hypothetical protein
VRGVADQSLNATDDVQNNEFEQKRKNIGANMSPFVTNTFDN